MDGERLSRWSLYHPEGDREIAPPWSIVDPEGTVRSPIPEVLSYIMGDTLTTLPEVGMDRQTLKVEAPLTAEQWGDYWILLPATTRTEGQSAKNAACRSRRKRRLLTDDEKNSLAQGRPSEFLPGRRLQEYERGRLPQIVKGERS